VNERGTCGLTETPPRGTQFELPQCLGVGFCVRVWRCRCRRWKNSGLWEPIWVLGYVFKCVAKQLRKRVDSARSCARHTLQRRAESGVTYHRLGQQKKLQAASSSIAM